MIRLAALCALANELDLELLKLCIVLVSLRSRAMDTRA